MNTFKTPTQIRQLLAKDYPTYANTWIKTFENASKDNNQYLKHALNLIKCDVMDIIKYQTEESDVINVESLRKWFPYIKSEQDQNIILTWLDSERDFVYNTHGLRLLKNRYLLQSEPIQYCMLRIAKMFVTRNDDNVINLKEWHIMYDILSCGFLHTSSILADAENADKNIVPGEACRLLVANPNYDRSFINQINEICNLISLGVGVGMSASTVPLNGSKTNGKIHSGFKSFAKKLDSCNYLTIYERKPKIAIYIEMHNDTIYEAFELRNPLKNHLENVFVGVMIPDHFIDCYENNKDWYLFPGNVQLNGKTLCDFSGEEYKIMYQKFVDAKLYTKVLPASKLMDDLVTCICETGSPYVIWSDNVNQYSNHKHLGKIKTLNLCAEITNFASVEQSSSCTLLSINYAMYKDFPEVLSRIYEYVGELSSFPNYNGLESCVEFEHYNMSKFAYAMGFIGTWALNVFMTPKRVHREIGINPLGVFDMALIENVDPVEVVAELSEAMYKGCIHSSCKYSNQYNVECTYYKDSPFSRGIPQFMLRDAEDMISTNWNETLKLMCQGMANSMLTAQAPTATTSMLIGVAESVSLPMSIIMSRESENGRNDLICYGILCSILNNSTSFLNLDNNIDRQILMYSNSAPFVDQSQSTMFSVILTRQNILNLIMDTYYAKLKTSIYYTIPKQVNNTLTIVNDMSNAKQFYESTSTTCNVKRSSEDDVGSKKVKKRRPSCDVCSA